MPLMESRNRRMSPSVMCRPAGRPVMVRLITDDHPSPRAPAQETPRCVGLPGLPYRFSMLLFLDMRNETGTRSLALFDAVLLLVIGLTGLVVLLNGIQVVADGHISELTVGVA